MSDKLKYTYMQDEHGSYIIIRDNEDIGLSPQDLCTHLNALEQRVERQAEHITHTDGSIENRNEKVRKWKRLHNELGKKYAILKQRVEGLEKALYEAIEVGGAPESMWVDTDEETKRAWPIPDIDLEEALGTLAAEEEA